ncbi:hypothetical protein GGI20_003853 [Coemansia sp. BCRC 34301]|nr:hypothetical protein GGI20_003853 [Coemansia sp. BCRC 34301]
MSSASGHYDYKQLLNGVSLGDTKDDVMATLSGFNLVDEGSQLKITCPTSKDLFLYVKFDHNSLVIDKGTS